MNAKNFTLREIRSSYPLKKKILEKNNFWGYYILRQISFPITWLFLKLRISANIATYISLIFGVIGVIFLSSGQYFILLIGVIFVNIWALLDYVDGNIARCINSSSKYGEFLDSIVGGLIGVFLFISLGLGIYNNPDDILYNFFPYDTLKYVFTSLGILTGLFLIFIEWIGSIFGQIFQTTKKEFFGSSYPLIFKIFFNFTNISGILMPLLFIFALINFLSFYLILFSFFFGINSLGSLMFLLMKSKLNV